MIVSTLLARLLESLRKSRPSAAILRSTRRPRIGHIDFGDFSSLDPISNNWGFDRGQPIDRFYIETFLDRCSSDIQGRVMEIGASTYCDRFGTESVEQIDVLDVDPSNPRATVVADLVDAPTLQDNSYDTVICTQTLQLLKDPRAGVATIHRILRPGGVALVSVPTLSRLADGEKLSGLDRWRFTEAGVHELLVAYFESTNLQIDAFGNLISAIAFLEGLSVEDLEPRDLDHFDSTFQILVTARAQKRLST